MADVSSLPYVYHMCIESEFDQQTISGGLYYPPTYNTDGFIHATHDPRMLLEVGTHFYKDSIGEWICIKLDVSLLPQVLMEAPAPVGDKDTLHKEDEVKFPHIYGGIDRNSVVEKYKIVRNDIGEFKSIVGLIN